MKKKNSFSMICISETGNFISTSELKYTISFSLNSVLQLNQGLTFHDNIPLFSVIMSHKHRACFQESVVNDLKFWKKTRGAKATVKKRVCRFKLPSVGTSRTGGFEYVCRRTDCSWGHTPWPSKEGLPWGYNQGLWLHWLSCSMLMGTH